MQPALAYVTPIYPELGRKLTSNDLNKMIVRVRPYFHDADLSFSYIPRCIETASQDAFQLIALDLNGITVLKGGVKSQVCKAEAFAPIYLTVTEFKEQAIFAKVVYFNLNSTRPFYVPGEVRLVERTVYPEIGRKLNLSDVCRKLVRTYPIVKDGKYNYIMVPMGPNPLSYCVDNLIAINAHDAEFRTEVLTTTFICERDAKYLTLEEYGREAPKAKKEIHVLAVGQLIEIRK